MDRRIPGVELDDWSDLATGDLVSVVEPRMAAYQGWIDEKMPSSDIVWIRRSDLGSRHLIDRHDGVVIVREQPSHTCSSTGCAHGRERGDLR